jgi:hypothetical protein
LETTWRRSKFASQEPDGTEFEITFIEVFHRRGFSPVDYQLAIANVITQRRNAAHPHSLALGGGDLVTNPLARYLTLELGE